LDVFEAIHKRKSAQAYETTPVSKETLGVVLEAGRLAPSAKNIQPWHFIVVTNKDKRKTLSKGPYAKFLDEVPAAIVLCGDQEASPDWYIMDVALAGENMVLAATNEGLNTCWVASFDEKDVQNQLGIPANLRVVAIMAIGYAKEKESIGRRILSLVHRRKKLDEITSWEMYGQALEVT
jgi:nitroreductase